jgi:serine/threonine protein kinase
MTSSNGLIGTLEYMAPERFNGQDSGAAADLYSLGVTLFQAAEGFSPFRRDTPTETLTAVVLGTAPETTRAGPLTPLISRLMAKDPANRPTVEQALAVLDGAPMSISSAPTVSARPGPPRPVHAPPVPARPSVPAKPRRKVGLIAGGVVLALAIGIGTAIALTSDDGGDDSSTNSSSTKDSSTTGTPGPSTGNGSKAVKGPDWCLDADSKGKCPIDKIAGCQHRIEIGQNVADASLVLQDRSTGDVRSLLQRALELNAQDLSIPHTPPDVQKALTDQKQQIQNALDAYAADGKNSRSLRGFLMSAVPGFGPGCSDLAMNEWNRVSSSPS